MADEIICSEERDSWGSVEGLEVTEALGTKVEGILLHRLDVSYHKYLKRNRVRRVLPLQYYISDFDVPELC